MQTVRQKTKNHHETKQGYRFRKFRKTKNIRLHPVIKIYQLEIYCLKCGQVKISESNQQIQTIFEKKLNSEKTWEMNVIHLRKCCRPAFQETESQ